MKCPVCYGSGVWAVTSIPPAEWESCSECAGTGEVESSADPKEESSGSEESSGAEESSGG